MAAGGEGTEGMILEVGKNLRINQRSRSWCLLPYRGHPRGCPNYGRRPTCPPAAPMVQDIIDITRSLWLLLLAFDIGAQARVMLSRHPGWTQHQARCVLYWQNRVNADLELHTKAFAWEHPGTIYTLCPEAMGVNVIATAQRLGLPIRVRPESTVYKIALVGYPQTTHEEAA